MKSKVSVYKLYSLSRIQFVSKIFVGQQNWNGPHADHFTPTLIRLLQTNYVQNMHGLKMFCFSKYLAYAQN